MKQICENTSALLKPLSRISSVQRVNCREDITAKRELLSASEH